ncbi:glucose-6-phosphate dehydrogenase, partial [Kipferlia bialata]
QKMKMGVKAHSRLAVGDCSMWEDFEWRLQYTPIDGYDDAPSFKRLARVVRALEGEEPGEPIVKEGEDLPPRRLLFYLATPPNVYMPIVKHLADAGLNDRATIIIEKPFGTNEASAIQLTKHIQRHWDMDRVLPIDHYLGKGTAMNIMVFRWGNALFEPLWNRDHISRVEVTVEETVDVGTRGGYYDGSGCLRDMIQNHLMQLMCFVAMESPADMSPKSLRAEKHKLLSSITVPQGKDALLGQYMGYQDVQGVEPGSTTPTACSIRLAVENWRWKDVPFILQTCKAGKEARSFIDVFFKPVPMSLFGNKTKPNRIRISIQPKETIEVFFCSLASGSDDGNPGYSCPTPMSPVTPKIHTPKNMPARAATPKRKMSKHKGMIRAPTLAGPLDTSCGCKVSDPTSSIQTRQATMTFSFKEEGVTLPSAYERLLYDAQKGDFTLFPTPEESQDSWKLLDGLIAASASIPVTVYPKGELKFDQPDGVLTTMEARSHIRKHIHQTRAGLAKGACGAFIREANYAAHKRGVFHFMAAGGTTPQEAYEQIALRHDEVDWTKVHVWFGDERNVPCTSAKSNYHMVHEALLSKIPLFSSDGYGLKRPHPNVHAIIGPNDGEDERDQPGDRATRVAEQYCRTFKSHALTDGRCRANIRMDLVWLGMGADGHTVSLFPGSAAVREDTKQFVAYKVPQLGQWRISVTRKVLAAARHTMVLLAGAEKSMKLSQVLTGPIQPNLLPLLAAFPKDGKITVVADAEAGLD